MSLRYRSGSGVETILAGLTPGGDIEFGAVAERSGSFTITDIAVGGDKAFDVIFSEPMPDTDYTIVFEQLTSTCLCSVTNNTKTVNGFQIKCRNLVDTVMTCTGSYRAFKTYTVQHAEQNAEDIANIKSMIPANASTANKLATSSDVTSLSTEVDGRLDDLEDVVPTSASITNKLVTQSELQAIEEADSITYDNTTSGLAATNVQDALDEIDAAVDDKLNVKTISNTSQVPQGDMAFLEDGIYYITSGVTAGGNLINLPPSLQYASGAMVIVKTVVTNALYKTYIYSPWDIRLPMFKGEVSFSSSQNPTVEWTPQIASNPNYIDNAWFTVNQRGQNSYSTYAYTVDRWKNASSSGVTTISPTSNGITIVNSHETSRGYFYQYFENMLPAGETYTLSAKSTQTKRWILQVRYNDGGTKTYAGVNVDPTSPEIMQYTFTATKPIDAILIETQAQSTTNIRAVKLEKGPYSTLSLDTIPNYQQELAKCQRFFERNRWYCWAGVPCSEAGYVYLGMTYPFYVDKRDAPTFSFNVIGNTGINNGYVYDITSGQYLSIAGISLVSPGAYNKKMLQVKMSGTQFVVGHTYSIAVGDDVIDISADL